MKYGRKLNDEEVPVIVGVASQKNKKKILEFMFEEIGSPLKYALPIPEEQIGIGNPRVYKV